MINITLFTIAVLCALFSGYCVGRAHEIWIEREQAE
jgi:hypothetical protein